MSNLRTTYHSRVSPKEDSAPAGNGVSLNSFSPRYGDSQDSESHGPDNLSIALIGPDKERRKEVAGALAECPRADVREFSSYPPALDDVPRLLEQYHDVILIDLDSNPDYAVKLVESICSTDSAAVMVYSEKADRDMVVRCMRAGAREYLTLPLEQNTMLEALGRAAPVRSSATWPIRGRTAGCSYCSAPRAAPVSHGCLQSRGCPGAGVGPEHIVDRSRSSHGRRGAEPRDRRGIFDRQRAARFGPARCELSHQAPGKASLGIIRSCGSQQSSQGPGISRRHRQAADHRAAELRKRSR